MDSVSIEDLRKEELEEAAKLVLRLKQLNGEFDPMFMVAENGREVAREYLRESLSKDDSVLLVAKEAGRIVGLIKADLRTRRFYEPGIEGAIVDFYILPERRRERLGEKMVNEMIRRLKGRGAQLVTAEFPSQNNIAVNFYKKLGFRSLVSTYAWTLAGAED